MKPLAFRRATLTTLEIVSGLSSLYLVVMEKPDAIMCSILWAIFFTGDTVIEVINQKKGQ